MTKMELQRVLAWAPKTGKTATGLARIFRERDAWPDWSDEAKIVKAFLEQFEGEGFLGPASWDEWIRFFDEMVQWAFTSERLALLVFEESRFQSDRKVSAMGAAYIARSKRVYAQVREGFCPELEPWGHKKTPDVTGHEEEEVR